MAIEQPPAEPDLRNSRMSSCELIRFCGYAVGWPHRRRTDYPSNCEQN